MTKKERINQLKWQVKHNKQEIKRRNDEIERIQSDIDGMEYENTNKEIAIKQLKSQLKEV